MTANPTILYFVPESVPGKIKSDITERLVHAFDATPLGQWGLEHRLFRSSAATKETVEKDGRKAQEWRYLHLLQMNMGRNDLLGTGNEGHDDVALVCFSDSGSSLPPVPKASNTNTDVKKEDGEEKVNEEMEKEDLPITSIPAFQLPEYSAMLSTKMGGLWTPRAAVHVANGSSYVIGDDKFLVRVGEVRQRTGPGGQQQGVKGVVVAIEMVGASDVDSGDKGLSDDEREKAEEEEAEYMDQMIRGLWRELGTDGGKEFATKRGKSRDGDEIYDLEAISEDESPEDGSSSEEQLSDEDYSFEVEPSREEDCWGFDREWLPDAEEDNDSEDGHGIRVTGRTRMMTALKLKTSMTPKVRTMMTPDNTQTNGLVPQLLLTTGDFHESLEQLQKELETRMSAIAKENGCPCPIGDICIPKGLKVLHLLNISAKFPRRKNWNKAWQPSLLHDPAYSIKQILLEIFADIGSDAL
ncbi:hypothetical protein NA57DRAFT_55133 [Rhizodiscina lignyota]|uniref:Mediator of RNA polymerase II transcription subunit 20 n=1 Tax=Rhizodiscina lignyota TaxID=1504668 RepID=A0A9P4IHD6_9PEZI|nr:hypothetical protein NA57DRAFT_55133 [Rhizodiscina lignyota]